MTNKEGDREAKITGQPEKQTYRQNGRKKKERLQYDAKVYDVQSSVLMLSINLERVSAA